MTVRGIGPPAVLNVAKLDFLGRSANGSEGLGRFLTGRQGLSGIDKALGQRERRGSIGWVNPAQGPGRGVPPVWITVLKQRTDQGRNSPPVIQRFERESG